MVVVNTGGPLEEKVLLEYRTSTASKHLYISVSKFMIELNLGSIEQTFVGMFEKA